MQLHKLQCISGSKFDMNEEALINMDKLLKGLTAEQLFDDW